MGGIVERAAADRRIDVAVRPLQAVLSRFGRSRPVADVLHGVPIGRAAHPLLVPVPVLAWSTAAVLEIRGHHGAARRLGRVGLAAILPVASPAAMDWSKLPRGDQRIGMVHALAVIGSVAGAALAGRSRTNRGAIALRLVGVVCLALAARLGVALAARRRFRGETPTVLAERDFTEG